MPTHAPGGPAGFAGLADEPGAFLREFLELAAPSGFEAPAGECWRRYAAGFSDDVRQDAMGNSFATVSDGTPRVAFVGHVDEIGLIVTRIDDKGFLRCTNIGGWDVAVLVGQRVRIMAEHGDVIGSVGRGAVHNMDAAQREKLPKLTDLWIDIGAADGEAARARVRVGDAVVLACGPVELAEHRLMSRALDDRLGSFTVLEAARACADAGAEVVAVGSVGEEIGAAGALAAAYSLRPDVAVVVDVTSPGDTPGGGDIGDFGLGKGPIITRGATTSRRYVDLLVETAEHAGIPYQLRGMGLRTRTDADQVTRAGGGVPVVLASIPGRYLHTPTEQCDMRDVHATIELLAAFARRVGAEQ